MPCIVPHITFYQAGTEARGGGDGGESFSCLHHRTLSSMQPAAPPLVVSLFPDGELNNTLLLQGRRRGEGGIT